MIDSDITAPALERPAGNAQRVDGDWQLRVDGLEHGVTGYFIACDALGTRRPDGLWEWPMHLAEKRWCSPRAFREVFLAALDRFGIERDAHLICSFAVGFGIRIRSPGPAKTSFVALGDLVRPKPVERKRPAPREIRSAARSRTAARTRPPVGARA